MPTGRTLTRRTALVGAGGLLALGVTGSAKAIGINRQTPTDGSRSIEHKYGTTEVPADPQRVVTVGYSDQDPVLALGVIPVAIRGWLDGEPSAIWPWAQDALDGDPPVVLPGDALNYEQIAGLRPDLIIGAYAGLTEEEYQTLSGIAPTVAQSAGDADYGTPWQEMTRTIGLALGRERRAAELVIEVEARFATARERHPAFVGATGVAAYSFGPAEYGFYGPADGRARFLAALGFELPAGLANLTGGEFFAELSRERFDLIEADVVVWIIANDGTTQGVEEDPLYRRLAVASEGRDIFLGPEGDPLQAAMSFGTVLSLPFALDGLVPLLVAAIDGDPATSATPAP